MKSLLSTLLVWSWLCVGFGNSILVDRAGGDTTEQFVAFLTWPALVPYAIYEIAKN